MNAIERPQAIVLAGIDTDAGKTLVSALLVQALGWDYWKPVQAGDLDFGDTDRVRSWVSRQDVHFHPEAYRLTHPMSPHAAAELDQIELKTSEMPIPASGKPLLVEMAGGLMVPLREDWLMIDWVASQNLPVILVSKYYLGSINHTLLSIAALRHKGIPILGIIFNGVPTPSTRAVILAQTDLPVLGDIPWMNSLDPKHIREAARFIHTDLISHAGIPIYPPGNLA